MFMAVDKCVPRCVRLIDHGSIHHLDTVTGLIQFGQKVY